MPPTVFIDATWDGEIVLGNEVIEYLKKKNTRSVALFASVQFLALDKVIAQLKDLGIDVKTTKAKRTHVPIQVLGCDAYEDSFESDIIASADTVLYIGDGMFHPKALLLSQVGKKEFKDIVIWDPVAEKMHLIGRETIARQIQKTVANLKRYLAADVIGILVTIKPGQQYFANALKLKTALETQGKRTYIFIEDTINLSSLENYPFIQAWVNTACPRIGMDDITTIAKPLINIRDAYDPVKALERMEYGK